MNKIFISLLFSITLICNTTRGQDHYFLISPRLSSFAQIENFNLLTECDSVFNDRYLKYWSNIDDKSIPVILDTVSCSPYNSELLIYSSKKKLDYLIFWVTENEYTSEIHIFYLTKNVLNKIGTLPILNDCETCDDQIYPINKISINGRKNEIIIKLLEPFKYDLGNDNLQEFQPGQAYFKLDKTNNKLIMRKL